MLGGRACTYTGVRTPSHAYFHHTEALNPQSRACEPVDDVEWYDLGADPFQLDEPRRRARPDRRGRSPRPRSPSEPPGSPTARDPGSRPASRLGPLVRVAAAARAALLVALAGCTAVPAQASGPAPEEPPPNIVLIVTDDQTLASYAADVMPHTTRLLEGDGNEVHQRLRHLAALLPVAGDDAHRPVRAQQRGAAQRVRRR